MPTIGDPGDLVWIQHWGKSRPGVILRLMASGRFYVLVGSTKPQTESCVTVEPNTRRARLWGLTAQTHFPALPAIVEPSAIDRVAAKCPFELFFAFEELVMNKHLQIPGPEQCATGPAEPVAVALAATAADAGED
jgi:hypothetical protein